MSITLVGDPFGATDNDGANFTITFPSGMQEDDILVVFGGHAQRGNNSPDVGPVDSTGWVEQAIFDTGTSGGNADTDFGCWTFVQPSVPVTSEDFLGSGFAQDACGYVGVCLRGADLADIVISSIIEGSDPPSVVTIANDSWVIISSIDQQFAQFIVPTGYSNSILLDQVDTNRLHVFLATKEVTTAGSEDPGGTSNGGETAAARCMTIAIKPAGAGGGGNTFHADQSDTVNLTDSRAVTQSKTRSENVDLSDAVAKQLSKGFLNNLALTDEIAVQKSKLFSVQDLLNETDSIEFILTKEQLDVSNLTDVFMVIQKKEQIDTVSLSDPVAKSVKKGLLESIGITDTITTIKTKLQSFTQAINITDSISITIKKVFSSLVGTSDTMTATGGTPSEVTVSSLVDTARSNYQDAFSVSDADMAKKSINDVMHDYWSGDFPLGHVYDGSESGLTPEDFSTMDHHARVESNEATDLNWIKDIV